LNFRGMGMEKDIILAGRYKIEKLLGEGGMGAVYLAKDLKFQEKYWAVKEFLNPFQEIERREKAAIHFKEEANLLASLNHPCLPVVSDHFKENDNHYMVMEYIKGSSLVEIDKVPDIAEILDWGLKLCEVLDYLHTREPQPVIYRDLKPENIMVTDTGDIKLIDFGISKNFDEDTRTATAIRGILSSGYAPPEQYTAGTDFRSDIYSLGATLYALIGFEMPPDARQRVIKGTAVKPLSLLNEEVTLRLEEVILKAMEVKKEDRYQTAKEMREELNLCLEYYRDGVEDDEEGEPDEETSLSGLSSSLQSLTSEVKAGFYKIKDFIKRTLTVEKKED